MARGRLSPLSLNSTYPSPFSLSLSAQSLFMSQSDSNIYPSSPQEATNHPSASLTTSSTSPNIASSLSPPSSSMETSRFIDSIDSQSTSPSDLNGVVSLPDSDNAIPQTFDVDPQILEALKGKDRIYVLKLGEQFEALI